MLHATDSCHHQLSPKVKVADKACFLPTNSIFLKKKTFKRRYINVIDFSGKDPITEMAHLQMENYANMHHRNNRASNKNSKTSNQTNSKLQCFMVSHKTIPTEESSMHNKTIESKQTAIITRTVKLPACSREIRVAVSIKSFSTKALKSSG